MVSQDACSALCFPEFHGRFSGDLLKDCAEIIAGGKAKLLGNFPDAERCAFQQNLRAFDLCKLHIVRDAQTRFFLEFMGEVIFRVAHQGGKIFRHDLLSRFISI